MRIGDRPNSFPANFPPGNSFGKQLGLFLTALLAAWPTFAASLAKGDKVQVIKEAPLYFNGTTLIRMAVKGEQFAVLEVRPKDHQVFVPARNAAGQVVAVTVSEDALALVPIPPAARAGSDAAQSPAGTSSPSPVGLAADLPVSLRARISEAARLRAITQNGGKKETEAAVLKGLKWLATQQNADGSWAPSQQSAMTGFALLAFLGHGETPASAEFGPTVRKAADWLLESGRRKQEEELSHMILASRLGDFMDGAVSHSIATCALAEFHALTRDARTADLLKQAVENIVSGQGPDGGWMYSYEKTGSEMWATAPQIEALKMAQLSGLNLPGVEKALERSMSFLRLVHNVRGGFGYNKNGTWTNIFTAPAIYCGYLGTQEKELKLRDEVTFLMQQIAKDQPVEYHHETVDLRTWYYNTHACFLAGGGAWAKWNAKFPGELLKNQDPRGSWPPVAGKNPGGDAQRDPEGIGPCYRTSLCLLMLEVYYRYLPEAAVPKR